MSLDSERREYRAAELRRAELDADPLIQFRGWLDLALEMDLKDATAMALATASPDAVPAVRIVLLKSCDEQGFSFFTDYRSQKGQDLAANPVASALFHWRELDRQVRLTGSVVKVAAATSQAYFDSRPYTSRLAAVASQQSRPISDRAALEASLEKVSRQHPTQQVPVPDQWGGYLLRPESFEFWQGREGRLHDRFSYSRISSGWRIERLQP